MLLNSAPRLSPPDTIFFGSSCSRRSTSKCCKCRMRICPMLSLFQDTIPSSMGPNHSRNSEDNSRQLRTKLAYPMLFFCPPPSRPVPSTVISSAIARCSPLQIINGESVNDGFEKPSERRVRRIRSIMMGMGESSWLCERKKLELVLWSLQDSPQNLCQQN